MKIIMYNDSVLVINGIEFIYMKNWGCFMDIGSKIKELRNQKGMTLKELSEATNLSIGFLSQLERGLTSVAIDVLTKISDILGVEFTYFFDSSIKEESKLLRSYEKKVLSVENGKIVQYYLTNNLKDKDMIPRYIEVLPGTEEDMVPYGHQGEEFIYVLEGVLTIYIENKEYNMYPGDSVHINSTEPHNWANYSNNTVRLLMVNTPNSLKNKK